MSRVTLLYMSREGQTKKISERMAHCLRQNGHQVNLLAIDSLSQQFSLEQMDAVVLGCSIRYGKHHAEFRKFVNEQAEKLNSIPSFFFSVNLTARKPERSQPYNNLYLKKYLESITWQPDKVEVFAGALLYSQYDLFNKGMIRLIMKMTGGPTDTAVDTEFTNWGRVIEFAKAIDQYLSSMATPVYEGVDKVLSETIL